MALSGYDARVLALPIEEPPENQRRSMNPEYHRRSSSYYRTASAPSSRSSTWRTTAMRRAGKLYQHSMKTYNKLSPLQRILVGVGGTIALVLGILFLVYSERIFHSLLPMVKKFRSIPAGWLIIWALIFVVSFPPLIGYSSLLTIAGFVYGFPNSWFIAASATVVGSTCSFIVSRSLLKNMVHRMVANDPRFAALSLTLKHDGIKILIMIRLCPLPYSLSNGAMSTFPTVHWTTFALATAIASLKLMLHLFVGARLGEIAEKGEEMDTRTKVISYISIFIGVAAGIITGWVIYRQTKARAAELEAEERANVRRASLDDLEDEYADDPDALEAATRLREDDDDISLHDTQFDGLSPYRDEPSSSDEDADPDLSDDVFLAGDGDEEQALVKSKNNTVL